MGVPVLLCASSAFTLLRVIGVPSAQDLGTSLTNCTNFPFYPVKAKRASPCLLLAFILETNLVLSNNRANLEVVTFSAVLVINQRALRVPF